MQMKPSFLCQECGHVSIQWAGKCDSCGSWNSLIEHYIPKMKHHKPSSSKHGLILEPLIQEDLKIPKRIPTYIQELDRVLGGGIVPGSLILLGGNPGIGKSTLLLQLTSCVQETCIYISGEESTSQIRLRAKRMDIHNPTIQLANSVCIEDIINQLTKNPPKILIIDSIQTMEVQYLNAAPGTITQVRTATTQLTHFAKKHNIAIILVGHVTKEGVLAGPRILEHMVDTVLYFEGNPTHQFRLLRSVKNRFGPTQEIGVFDMKENGLQEIKNPSLLFLGNRENEPIPGSCTFSSIEGTRPLLVEIQALVASTGFTLPRRTSIGLSSERLAMILAVLEVHAGFSFSNKDVYLNLAGGIRIVEPASDLAVALAIISSITSKPIPFSCAVFGEIALNGEIRPVTYPMLRVNEAKKLGFLKILMPKIKEMTQNTLPYIIVKHVRYIHEILKNL